MNKTLVTAGAALLAASMASLSAPTTAEAKKSLHFGGHHHHHHHRHHHRRHIIVVPVHTETYRVRKPAVVAPQKVVVSYADGKGRVFDPASKAWHDGQNRCWSGQLPWTFKAGAWFYGSYSWSQVGDTWRTNAPEAPLAIDCQGVPAFAAKAGPTQGNPKDLGGYSSDPTGPTPPVKSAEKPEPATPAIAAGGDPAAAGACKKYFPSVGETLPVPCTN